MPDESQTSLPPPQDRKAIIVGVSGCSSSGKTTLSHLLADVFPHTRIIHEDDFYKAEAELPFKSGLRDWDSAGSLNIPLLASTLSHILVHGAPPPDAPPSLEPPAPPTSSSIAPALLSSLRTRVASALPSNLPPIYILDGFLLYGPTVAVLRPLLTAKLFLRATYAEAKARRESRMGYVTIEGWWEDPPAYVDRVVWPNYVAEHAFLFEGGDVEGKIDGSVMQALGIRVVPAERMELRETLEWAVEVLVEEVKREADDRRG